MVSTFARHLLELQRHIDDLEQAITAALHDDQAGKRLQGIPGTGPLHAATVRAQLGDVARFGRVDQVVAYAGLDPPVRQSGAFVGQRKLSKRGPGALRHALYLATLVATRCRPEWRERYQKLLARGHSKKEALTILSRALLKVVYHLLVSGDSYDADKIKPRAVVAAAGA